MRKILFVFLMILGTLSFWSQQRIIGNGKMITVTRNISDYSGVALKGSFNVVLTNAPQGEITITAEENIVPIIVTEVKNKILEVSVKPSLFIQFKKATVFVPHHLINTVLLIGSGDIKTEGMIKSNKIFLTLNGSGDLQTQVDAKMVVADLNGSGDLSISGYTENFHSKLKGSGDIEAIKLDSKNADAFLQGSGDIQLTSTVNFKGNLKGSGDIKVYGYPSNVEIIKKGSGKIKVIK